MELTELLNLEKGKDFHGPYHAPSSKVFRWHCENIVKRYRLENTVQKGKVVRIVPKEEEEDKSKRWFEVHIQSTRDSSKTYDKQEESDIDVIQARRIVVAAGSTTIPVWPIW